MAKNAMASRRERLMRNPSHDPRHDARSAVGYCMMDAARIAEIRMEQPDLLAGWETFATALFRIYFWMVGR
jgi:hypothetical protein